MAPISASTLRVSSWRSRRDPGGAMERPQVVRAILVTWRACSMAIALVRTPWQFSTVRFLLGLAESGFFPGVIVYLTHWFPPHRARAMAGLVLAVPVSQALGARVSGVLLEVHWLGLQGWQWVFLGEGLPAVLLGIALPWIMTDRPSQARWLEPAERHWLERTLEAERRELKGERVAPGAGGPIAGRLGARDGDLRHERRGLCVGLLSAVDGRGDARQHGPIGRRRRGFPQVAGVRLPLRPGRRVGLGADRRPHRASASGSASPRRCWPGRAWRRA